MTRRIRLGMLTPSSNTVLEPVTSAMVSGLPEVSVHFSRFTVREISLRENALGQFEHSRLLEAASLLADARVDVIAWNGTSAGWLGFDTDTVLCEAITKATGIPACTSVLALNEVLATYGARRLGLVTPYTADVQRRIIDNYAAIGIDTVAEEHLGETVNFAFGDVDADTLRRLVRRVAGERPHAITTFCTNLRAAPLVEPLERETGIALLDTISVVIWKALQLADASPVRVRGWGRLFRDMG